MIGLKFNQNFGQNEWPFLIQKSCFSAVFLDLLSFSKLLRRSSKTRIIRRLKHHYSHYKNNMFIQGTENKVEQRTFIRQQKPGSGRTVAFAGLNIWRKSLIYADFSVYSNCLTEVVEITRFSVCFFGLYRKICLQFQTRPLSFFLELFKKCFDRCLERGDLDLALDRGGIGERSRSLSRSKHSTEMIPTDPV